MEEALEVLLAALGGLLVVTVAVDALTTTWRSARDLHYFHSAEPATSARLQLIILDEALTLLDGGVAPDTTRPQRLLNRTRQSLDGYCDVVAGYVPPARERPRRRPSTRYGRRGSRPWTIRRTGRRWTP